MSYDTADNSSFTYRQEQHVYENVFISIPQIHKFGILEGGWGGGLYFGMHAIDEDCTIRVKCRFTT